MSMPDILTGLPYTVAQCEKLRRELLRDMSSDSNPNREIRDYVRKELKSIKRQGSGYGALFVGSIVVFTYLKAPNSKPHYAGILIGMTIAYCLGGIFALKVGQNFILNTIGIIKESQEFEKRRRDIAENCKKY